MAHQLPELPYAHNATDDPLILFADGYEMERFPGQSAGPTGMTDGSPGGDMVWQYQFDYEWLIGKDGPAS